MLIACMVIEPFIMRGKNFRYGDEIVMDYPDFVKLEDLNLVKEIDL